MNGLAFFSWLYSVVFLPLFGETYSSCIVSYSQQVYTYFRGSGKVEEVKREAARSTMMAAM